MEFSSQQETALKGIDQWLRDGRTQLFRLWGFAGSGKSTIAHHVAQGRDVRFAAFTGKAATVMRSKGCAGATTIHSMIYKTHGRTREWLDRLENDFTREQHSTAPSDGRLRVLAHQIRKAQADLKGPSFSLNEEAFAEGRPALICIDECSMVDERIGTDLLSFKIPVLVIGDPAQLPPVKGAGFFTNTEPDVLLTEIHRQAEGNPIIELATIVRKGGRPRDGHYGNSYVGPRSGIAAEDYEAADQILIGKNATRKAWNTAMRERLGHKSLLPSPGEKVVCLRNNHDNGLMNGSVWIVESVTDCPKDDTFRITVRDEENTVIETEAHKGFFLGQYEPDWQERQRADEFDFAYAMTVHKFQGSQANKVIYFDEWPIAATYQQHMYTGITRAAESIAVVS